MADGVLGPFPRSAPRPLLLAFLWLCCWCWWSSELGCVAQAPGRLHPREVAVLRQIASKLKVGFWDFSRDPCSGSGGWLVRYERDNEARNLTCSCNSTSNICVVTSIQLKSQNLTGFLPEEFASLTSLVQIDLSRNYLNGSIPIAWTSLPLVNITLLGNRISGQIPKQIGRISTLQSLVLENNLFDGPLPGDLGRLTNLNRLLLSANNFSGQLPEALAGLTNLTDFRIDGNPISGGIPAFIGNWTRIQRIDMQGTSLRGVFPSIFATLGTLKELRVSDLDLGSFPPMEGMKMKTLVLRNCSLSGTIPSYIAEMPDLKTLDLSFNNFTGEIPGGFGTLKLDYMYLTNNLLNGEIPNWILKSNKNLDLSYNSFTPSQQISCGQGSVNFVSSFSSSAAASPTCLRCSGRARNYELYINCGGEEVMVDGQKYEKDIIPRGPSAFAFSESSGTGSQKWAYSSTGDFVGKSGANYIATNSSALKISSPQLYMSARANPLSLKYYGLCLQKGNYTVKLHFSEIIFTDDQTYLSVGRRVFDVSIQGQKVLKDFNIADAANGTGREIKKSFFALVNDSTLEIHLQWAGKGTNAIPERGVYGPLISAITVTPNFTPELDEKRTLSVGAIVGISVSSCIVILLFLLFLWFCLRKRDQEDSELTGLELQTGYFSLRQIKAATGNFSSENKIGEGGFGPVYKGVLHDGSSIAVKQLSSKSRQGNREFVTEIGMISALQHPNLVKLFGCCIEGHQLILVYEYLENNSLARALFGPPELKLNLDWQTRRKICLGIARGLAYLHEESVLKIVHRDIKATNILLDKDLNAKISDFGLARLDDDEHTHISTRIAGTVGYMAPEYAMRGYLTYKADVYSFGIVVLETVSGKSNTNYRPKDEFVYLLDWAYVLQEQGTLLELVDPSLGSKYSKEEAQMLLDLALICTNPSPTLRPTMSTVVSMIEGRAPVQVPVLKRTFSEGEEMRFRSFQTLDNQAMAVSMDGPWTTSSKSIESGSQGDTTYTSRSKLLPEH